MMNKSILSVILPLCVICILISGFTNPLPTFPAEPTPVTGDSQTNETDDMVMVFIPAGDFTMGFDRGSKKDMAPGHTVTLNAFWIDRTEVTNGQYAKCVSAGVCEEPQEKTSHNHVKYYNSDQYTNFPVINVSWSDANDYCKWAGRGLPTEAQWEKAARAADGRIYPWGDDIPTKELANYGDSYGDTVMTGSYPEGASLYGALDMAGNVREWTADWYDEAYYKASPKEDPQGPDFGYKRATRGGSWGDDMSNIRTFIRWGLIPITRSNNLGFRCSMPG